jgi:hypothetical protein
MDLSQDIKSIISRGSAEFSNRMALLSLWQELALNFYPQRANFTHDLTLGQEYASHLTTSHPVIVMRTLQNTVPSMLRPRDKDWFKVITSKDSDDDEDSGLEAKEWLNNSTKLTRKALYNRESGFIRAVSEADSDFMCFGNSVKYLSENKDRTGLMLMCIHLKEVCWFEDLTGRICEIHRKADMTATEAVETFGKDRLHAKMIEAYGDQKKKNQKFKVHHVMVKASYYSGIASKYEKKFKWVSLWIDIDNNHIIEEVGSHTQKYIIARWQTVSGFQYGYSLASQIALPDARLLQDMALTALEAAQKAVDPPVIATDDVVRGDVNLFAGGITVVDKDYDERLGQAVRPMTVDKSGLSHGMSMMDMVKMSISDGLYENKISLPPISADMTATEVMQRVKEYARTALPLFAPLEEEDNAVMIEQAFEILMINNVFGTPDQIPDALSGKEISFEFMSPIQDSRQEDLKQQYLETLNLKATTMQIDPDATISFDTEKAFTNVLRNIDIPPEWLLSDDDIQKISEDKKLQQGIAEAAQTAQNAGAGMQAAQGLMGQ